MAVSYVLPIFHAEDDAGRPLVGGKLTTFLSGTTTPAVSYLDAAGTPNTNPVTLNARGEARVFLDDGVSYTFVLKDGTGVEIWTQDGVQNANAGVGVFSAKLLTGIGTTLVGWLPLGIGGILRTLYAKLCELPLSPRDFGGKGDNIVNDFDALQKLGAACKLTGLPADLRCGIWRITGSGTLDWSGVRTILCDMQSPIIDARSGVINTALIGTYCMTIGTPDVDWSVGRAQAPNIIGQLSFVTVGANTGENGRSRGRRGLFIKCSWPNGGAYHAQGFNGTGVKFDSVHDGITPRIRVEECGNSQEYALDFTSQGDTTNCLSVPSLQCEQSYDKAIRISAIRSTFGNLHMERTYIVTTNDGTPTLPNGTNYTNISLNLGDCEVRQVYTDARVAGTTTPDGTAVTATSSLNIAAYVDRSEVSTFDAPGSDFIVTGGEGGKYSTVTAANFYQRAPASNTRVEGVSCSLYSVENSVTTLAPRYIGQFNPSFNAVLLKTIGGTIGLVDFGSLVIGDITFSDVKIAEVRNTRVPSGGGRAMTTFFNCQATLHSGSAGALSKWVGGYITTMQTVGDTKPLYQMVDFGAFNPQGVPNYVTLGCTCAAGNVVTWTTPSQTAASFWTSYQETQRLGGYAAVSSAYIYRPSDNTWQATRGSP